MQYNITNKHPTM